MTQFAQSSSIHAASEHYAVDSKRIREWIQYLKAGKFNGISYTAARLPGGGRHVINEEDDDESTESPMTPMLRTRSSLATNEVEFIKKNSQPSDRTSRRFGLFLIIKPFFLSNLYFCHECDIVLQKTA